MPTPQPVSFTSLRLSPKEFAAYSAQNVSDGSWKLPVGETRSLKVVGARGDVTEVIRKSNPKKREYLEVEWSFEDTAGWIMQRLEEKLRIPLEHWALAADGVVFVHPEDVQDIRMFQNDSEQPVLILLPKSDVEDWLENNPKASTWKRLVPDKPTSSEPREVAKAKFHLIAPIESDQWSAYVANRLEAEKFMDEKCESFDGDEENCVVPQIQENVKTTLREAVKDKEMQDAIADGVVVMSHYATDDGGGSLRDCDIITRIYSPTSPASVDVSFTYHQRTRWSSVEWFYMICYRINDTPPPAGARVGSIPNDLRRIPKGWKLLCSAGLEDMSPGRKWRAIEWKKFRLAKTHVESLHRHLFGPAKGDLAKKFHKVHMIRLMLGSVGIAYGIDVKEGANEKSITDGRQRGVDYNFDLGNKDEWLAVRVRKACGAALKRDADFKDYDPREEMVDDAYDSDEDMDDEDDEYDEDDMFRWIRR